MVKSYPIKLTDPELNLFVAMRDLCYGEMFGVEIKSGEPVIELLVPTALHDLILYIRSGVQYIDVLTVHNGLPACAETDLKIEGFRCRKKVKFPTG